MDSSQGVEARKKARRERAEKRAIAEAKAAKRHGLWPVLGGVIIDVVDVATIGGLGIVGGMLVGSFVSYAVFRQQGVSRFKSLALGAVGGVYCAIPFTEALPLATLLTLISGLVTGPKALPAAEPEPATEPSVDPIRVAQVRNRDRG
jgi:hypothetical protein